MFTIGNKALKNKALLCYGLDVGVPSLPNLYVEVLTLIVIL